MWHGIYLGAAGVLWALDFLGSRLDLAGEVLESYRARPEFESPSAWIGESGIALVAWRLAPSAALADRIAELLVVPEDDSLELMWGSPGLLLIADAMFAATGEERWAAASHTLVEHLLARRDERGLWTQLLYGKRAEYLGPVHGWAGVIAALAHHSPVERAADVLEATAVREGPHANWPPLADVPLERKGAISTQWCHGAPGMVTSMAALPADERLDDLLLAGGELTWAAGPLRKGANLCHGTAGNGFAFLKLFTRTGDELWLTRARRFAMHAAAQVAAARQQDGRGRYTLWTGDLGTAVFLQQCIAGTSDLPALDIW